MPKKIIAENVPGAEEYVVASGTVNNSHEIPLKKTKQAQEKNLQTILKHGCGANTG